MIEFYYSEKFKENIEGKDFKDIIYNKISENKGRTDLKNIGTISCFTNSVYVLKTSNPKTRTIIEEKNIEINGKDIKVFFVREIIANKNFDYQYGKKIFPQLKSGEWIKNNPLPKIDIDNFISSYKNKSKQEKEKRDLPPIELTSWLKDFKLHLNNEIFETENWVGYALSNSISDGMIDKYVDRIRIVIQEIIDNNISNSEIIKESNEIKIKKYINRNIGIIYTDIYDNKNNKIYLLHSAALIEHQQGYWEKQIEEIKSNDIDFENNLESISRKAFRSYPKWTINKDELWFAIQKSKEISNLSLTREQTNFLKTFKFPYYINGQAGSGKSTMLYYLFANSYYYKCLGEIQGDIIFITENETLLKLTKNAVFDLLTNNPEFSGLTPEQKNNSNKYFNSFKHFLLQMLTENDRKKFIENKYLDFSTFKQLYENSNIPKHIISKYSAEESWFTIITYIYGYDINKKISSDSYNNVIPNKSQTIPLNKFKGIEKNVLPFYEKLINEDGYWDKIKIIKYITANLSIKKKYDVLICDEAQDFCKVELHFILKLSKYLEYDLSNIEQVPVVFAGDPNQTVNPTGFRQDEMTSMLYEELQEIAKFNYSSNKNIYNPSYNYRSSQPVVSLANFVQYHRMKHLGIKQIKPQEAKRPALNIDKEFNVYFNYKTFENNPNLKRDLIEKLKYKVFIIPVNELEKDEYISKNEILSSIEKVEVKTSVESKGAEYEQVVLFGFGEYFLNNFNNLSNKKSDVNDLFKRSFFFNKLYVGLTRAQTELIIIDNEQSEELFWKKIVNGANITTDKWEILNNYKDKTIVYNPGTLNNVIKSTKEDALNNAKKDKEQGLYDKNASRLKVAANQFFKIGDKEQAYECLALSEQMKGNWVKAANYYLNSILKYPKYEEAAICLFNGREFNKLITDIGNNLKTVEQDIRIIISRLINGEKIMKNDISILKENIDKLNELIKNLEWRDELIEQFILSSRTINIIENKKDFVIVLESIANSKDTSLWKEIGNIRYNLKNYKEAIDAWTEIDFFEDNEKYFISQIELAKQNNDVENITLWLDALLKFKNNNEKIAVYNKIINNFKDEHLNDFSWNYLLIVYKSYILQKPESTKILEIGKVIEAKSNNNYNIEFYEKILSDEIIKDKIANYIVERWVKNKWKSNNNLDLSKLNNRYKLFSEKHKIIFKEFTFNELQKIPEYPEIIKWEHENQFRKITIRNFRRFDEIALSNIGQYNLIVGDNNVGKTSLLEALLITADIKEYIEYLSFAYINRKDITKQLINNEERYSINNNFIIDDYVKKDTNTNELEFILEEHRNYWNYKIKKTTINEIETKFDKVGNENIEEYISFIQNDSNIDIINILSIIKKIVPKNAIKSSFIPFGKGFGKDLALIYYENIERIKSERNNFINSMKVFIPHIERINVNTEKGEIDIEEQDFEVPFPLHQYGEGANKLFRILVQITLQKNNKLLIDEIDAGIHYSHFSDFWKTILKAASQNNVQIYATTHNLECIKYFSNILKEDDFKSYQNNSRIITLRELPENNIRAYTRTFDEFEFELNNDFELRGGDL